MAGSGVADYPDMSESAIERKCVQYAKGCGYLMPKWTAPGTAGVHDRLLIMPSPFGGQIYPIEFKTRRGRLSKLQHAWHRRMDRLGVEHYTIRSVEEFMELIDELR